MNLYPCPRCGRLTGRPIDHDINATGELCRPLDPMIAEILANLDQSKQFEAA